MEETIMKIKICSKCKTKKVADKSNFPTNTSGNKDNFHSWCRKCLSKASRQRYYKIRSKNPQQLRDYSRKWRSKNIIRARELAKQYHERRRMKILIHYGGNPPKCVCCGENRYEFLSIDHIKGGGLEHLRNVGQGRAGLSGWIVKNKYPEGFQILCHNCNFAKGHYGKCPHKKGI
jgi:hypothetical protein